MDKPTTCETIAGWFRRMKENPVEAAGGMAPEHSSGGRHAQKSISSAAASSTKLPFKVRVWWAMICAAESTGVSNVV